MIPLKRGRRRSVKKNHIQFLKDWFNKDTNVGKSFKYAFEALKHHFKNEISVSQHGCYKSFRQYSGMTYKRIQRVKEQSNTEKNKSKRKEYLRWFV